jgi:hypothetical protein
MPSSHRESRARRAAAVALLVAACGGDSVVPPPPAVRSVRIEPRNIAAQAGATLGFRAVVEGSPGVDTTVRWSSEPSPSGQISASGLLTTCYPPGFVRVTATSLADTTKRDTLSVPVTIPAVGWAFVGGIAPPGVGPASPGEFLDRGAVAGDVDLVAWLTPAGVIACRAVERIELRLRGPGVDTAIGRVDFAPPFREARQVRVRFRSAAVPNGAYTVSGTVHITDVPHPVGLDGMSITVRNP